MKYAENKLVSVFVVIIESVTYTESVYVLILSWTEMNDAENLKTNCLAVSFEAHAFRVANVITEIHAAVGCFQTTLDSADGFCHAFVMEVFILQRLRSQCENTGICCSNDLPKNSLSCTVLVLLLLLVVPYCIYGNKLP